MIIGPDPAGSWVFSSHEPHSKLGNVAKPGLGTNITGAPLQFVFDTRQDRTMPPGMDPVTVRSSFIASYANFGSGRARCVSGCTCETQRLNGVTEVVEGSVLRETVWRVSQHAACRIDVTFDGPEGTRFKLASIVAESSSPV